MNFRAGYEHIGTEEREVYPLYAPGRPHRSQPQGLNDSNRALGYQEPYLDDRETGGNG